MKLRNSQEQVLRLVTEAIAQGKTDIFIQAPTGTGKSLIALEISKNLLKESKCTSYIMTSEKSLQQQYQYDCTDKFKDRHGDVISICGIDTYKCHLNNEKFSLGVCRSLGMNYTAAQSLPCSSTCEYISRWSAAKQADRVLMNYSYWLIQMNYVYSKLGPVAPFKPRDVIICDEAHKIPDIVESHFACKLDINIVSKINFGIEALNQIGRKKYRPIDTLPLFQAISFAISCEVDCPPQQHYSALKSVYATMSAVNKQLGAIKTEVVSQYIPEGYSAEDLVKWSGLLPKAVKQFMKLCDAVKDHHCKVEDYTNMIEKHGLDYMVADNEEGDRVYHNMSDFHLFHKHFRKFAKTRIYMSATLQPQLLIERWQLNPEQCQVINVHSDWDHRRSPIVFCDKNINLGYKGGASAIAKAVQSIDNILDGHASHRGIIHTTTHAIAAQLLSSSRHQSRLYTYQTTAEKCELLDKIDELPKDAVLVGPSLYTGIDCTDDRARFNIIVKLAFPNVASRLWATRFDQCKDVYFGETASVLEQSAGRTSRHKDDYSITYIIDSRAADFVKYSGKYLSSTFLSRLVY